MMSKVSSTLGPLLSSKSSTSPFFLILLGLFRHVLVGCGLLRGCFVVVF